MSDAKLITALIDRIGRLISTEAHTEGLLPVQWETLRYLTQANRFSKTAAALTAYLGITKGTVSQTLKTLEQKGLIKKRSDAKDRRINHLALTSKGTKLLQRDPLQSTVNAVQDLGGATQTSLKQGLELLLSTRLAAQDRKPFGLCRECRYFTQSQERDYPHFCQLLQEKLSATDSLAICFEQQPA